MVGLPNAVTNLLSAELFAGDVISERGAAMSIWDDVLDRYSGFDHRANEGRWTNLAHAPFWVRDPENRRRIVSYNIAKAYQETVGRFFHERDGADSDYYQNRERGHAGVLIARTADGIIGEDPEIFVRHAEEEVPPEPVVPEQPQEPEGDDPVQAAAFEAASAFYVEEGRRAVASWLQSARRQQVLKDRMEWLNEWARQDSFWRKMSWAEEENTVPQGDGVMVFTIDPATRLPSVDVWAPSAFFKVPDPFGRPDEFSRRVHLVWEFDGPVRPGLTTQRFVRRITYELLDVPEWTPAYGGTATQQCFWSDAVWEVTPGVMSRDMQQADFDSFPLNEATFLPAVHPITGEDVLANTIGLPMDFIPVIHWKHTNGGTYGRSELARRVGLIDDMISADTASALISILCGEPPISIKDGTPDTDIDFGPAAAIAGDAQKIGFAQELLAIIEYTNMLERQYVKLTGLSSELAGRENREQSGRAIGLKMTPYRQLINKGRQARDDQGGLLVKFVQRLAIVARSPGITNVIYEAGLRWGTFIPEDQTEVVDQIILLRDRGLLTDEDVYDWLIAAGFNFRNPQSSLEFLRSIDIKTASALAEIIGHKGAAEYLGRPLDEDTVPALMEAEAPAQTDRPTSATSQPGPNQLDRRQRSNNP